MSPTLNLNEYDEVKVSDQHSRPGSFNDLEQYNDFVLFSRRATIARGDVVVLDDPKEPEYRGCETSDRPAGGQGDAARVQPEVAG